MTDMLDVVGELLAREQELISPTNSLQEAAIAKEKYSSSVTLKVTNYTKDTLMAVRAWPKAGEIEVPVSDVPSLSQGAILCYRITRPPSKSGCAGTTYYKIGDSECYLHIMWSSPNNFDRHASHLAVGVTQERGDKFNDMYFNRPSWFTRKYVYHDTQGLWFSADNILIHARSSTRPVADVDVYVFPADANNLPEKLKDIAKNV